MHVHHSINTNTRKQNDHKIHPTPGPSQSLEIIIRFWTRKNQLNNYMQIIKNNSRRLLENSILWKRLWPNNANETDLPGVSTDKKNYRDRETNHLFLEFKCITFRRSDRIQEKRHDPTYLFRCILHIRTRGTQHRRWIFYPSPKIQQQPTNNSNEPRKRACICGMWYHEKRHGISYWNRIGNIFLNFQKATCIHNYPSEMGRLQPLTTVATYSTAENIIMNGTDKKKIQSNIHEILLGVRQNMTKSFPRNMGWRKEKSGGLFHQTPPNLAPHNYATNIFETTKKYIETQNTRKLKPDEGVLELSILG